MSTVAEEMAAILAQHEDCAFSASGVVVCSCGAALQPNEVMWDMSNLAAHQAEQLAANGYGKLPEPVTEWGAAFKANGNPYNYHRTQQEAEDFVKSMNEVDADMIVITRQHTPATNTEWIPA